MPSVSRIGDVGVGICCCHQDPTCIGMTGILVTGAGTVFAEKSNVSRIGDIMLGSCGHTGVMISGSGTVFAEGVNIVRLGDSFSGCFTGTVVTGAATVIGGG